LTADTAQKKLRRMALQILEQHYDAPELVLLGIKERGMIIARHVECYLAEYYKGSVVLASLQIDKKQPGDVLIDPLIDFNDKVVILIDDVANTGRTMLYALKPLLNSYPKKIQTLALVERTYKSFPIALDYIGLSVATRLDEYIYVASEDSNAISAYLDTISAK